MTIDRIVSKKMDAGLTNGYLYPVSLCVVEQAAGIIFMNWNLLVAYKQTENEQHPIFEAN